MSRVLAGLATGVGALTTSTAQSDKWWPGYGNGPDNSRYFASRQIDKSNVNRLHVSWTYPHGDTGSVPIAVRGVIYGRGRNGSLVAIDAKTGAELWVRENMTGMTGRGLNYWESADGRDQRLIFSMDSLLQEVDAKTGQSIMSFGRNGVVDLREGIDGRDPSTIGNIQSNTPGEVFENLIILGSATGEGYMSPPGRHPRLRRVDAARLVWTFHTVPRPGEFGYDTWPTEAYKYIGGNNNWGEMTIDTRRGIAYIPLGSPTYDFYGADRLGRQPLRHLDRGARRPDRQAAVALPDRAPRPLGSRPERGAAAHDHPAQRAQSGRRRRDRQDRLALCLRSRDGRADLADRGTAGSEERDGRRAELADAALSDQSPPFVKHTFGVEDISPYLLSGRTPRRFKRRLLAADNKGIFTPISLKDTVHVPTSNGGMLFGGTAAGPAPVVYVVAHENPGILRLLRPGEGRGGRPAAASRTGRLPAVLSGVPRPRAARHRNRRAARAPGRRSGEQHRGGCAALRCRGDPHGARDRQGPDAVLSPPRRRRRRQSRGLPDGDRGRGGMFGGRGRGGRSRRDPARRRR